MKNLNGSTFPAFFTATVRDVNGDLYQIIDAGAYSHPRIQFTYVETRDDIRRYTRKEVIALGHVFRRFMHENPHWHEQAVLWSTAGAPVPNALKPNSSAFTHFGSWATTMPPL